MARTVIGSFSASGDVGRECGIGSCGPPVPHESPTGTVDTFGVTGAQPLHMGVTWAQIDLEGLGVDDAAYWAFA